jgi:hypothetical protein
LWGVSKNNLALSQARAVQVRAYFRYIWNIDPDRIKVSARKLPELPSTSSVEEGMLENQRVEIHSDSPQIFDSIKTTYTFEVADFNEINIHPDIQLGYDLKNWNIEIKSGGEFILKDISTIFTEKISLDKLSESGTITACMVLIPASLKSANSNKIQIQYIISKKEP